MNGLKGILLCWALLSLQAGAQNYITPMTADLTPPTPQSAQIMEYQMPQPAMLTGAVDLAVPLYTVQCADYALPLYMQYHSNGIKVMDDPCPYGYGWALMPALRATRTILGRPDELYDFATVFDSDPMITAFQCMVQPFAESYYHPGLYDGQHDIISLALPDHTVTRVIDFTSGKPVFSGGCDGEYTVSSDVNLDSITVIDPRGIRYLFAGTCEEQPTIDLKPYRTCWPLKKITLPGGECISISWSMKRNYFGGGGNYLGGYSFLDRFSIYEWWNSGVDLYEFNSSNYDNTIFQEFEAPYYLLRISEINFPGGSVSFKYERVYYQMEMMKKIVVSNSQGVIRTIDFEFDSSNLRLSKLKLSNEGDYSFRYMEGSEPRPNIHSQDWWGFFNNKKNPSLTPKFRIKRYIYSHADGFCWWNIGEADRSVDTVAMMNNILTGVTYPTGGTCTFEYEPHKFKPMRDESASNEIPDMDNPYLSYGGGLRVKRITASGTPDLPARVVTYEYSQARVRAVPSVASFIDVSDAVMGLLNVDYSSKWVDYIRSVNIRPLSDYMRFDIGETPVWYDSVKARYAEGSILYVHKDMIPEGNYIDRKFGVRSHGTLSKVYSQGPQLVAKEIYAAVNGKEALVERDSMTYAVERGTTLYSRHIYRKLIHVHTASNAAPDFDNVREVCDAQNPKYNVDRDPYEIIAYGVQSLTERLTGRVHTVYTDNGAVTTTDTYNYKAGTSLLASTSTTTSEGGVRTTAVEYADASKAGVQAQMVEAGAVGIPLRETTTCGTASVEYRAEYVRAASGAFVPRSVTTTLGSGGSLQSPVMTYNAAGRPVQSTDADGRSTAWLWGYGGLHPVVKVEGLTHAELCARDVSVATAGDHAEGLAPRIGDRPVWRYGFSPLRFLTEVTAPWGTHTAYGYGWRDQLASVHRNGTLIARHTVSLYPEGGTNRLVDGLLFCDARILETTTEFDGFGRPTRRYDDLNRATSITRYDAMGRAEATSVPLPEGTEPGDTDWSLTGFEASPRAVAEWAMRPGEQWAGAGRRSTVRHLTNTPEGEYQCFRMRATGESIIHMGIYTPGRLHVSETTDEDGHLTRSYTTLDGRLVQTSEGKPGNLLHTRYIYDDYGRLCAVLPPDIGGVNGPVSSPAVQNRAYLYSYDDCGRRVSAKMPGCEPALTRYSRAGRVIAEHTPGMADGTWLLHHYDACGREVLSSLATATEQQLGAIAANLPVATYAASATGCYSFAPALPVDVGSPQKAVFYDSYSFLAAAKGALPAISQARQPLGLVAGSRDYAGGSLLSAVAYDAEGFVAEEAAQTPFGTLHRSYTRDRQGAVLSATEDFKPSTGAAIHRATLNTYDAGGRLTRRSVTENGHQASVAFTYDHRGNIATETCGNGVKRRYSYDIHNWPVKTVTEVPLRLSIGPTRPDPIRPGMAADYYGAIVRDSNRIIPIGPPALPVDTLTEQLFYADGAVPRYTGAPSGRLNILGGRYDYRYDAHDRLTRADYTPAKDGDEDFSASYSYDILARPTQVNRLGITDVDADGNETFGQLDLLAYTYDAAGRIAAITNAPDGDDYYSRPGFPAAGSEDTWDAAGRMTADTGRGITAVKYDHRNLPLNISFDDGRNVANIYDADGALVRTVLVPKGIVGDGFKPVIRTYAADRVWEDGRLLYSYFPGGYFDGDGTPHYLHNDYQGSVVLVSDSAATIEQRNTYYPYGTPHRTPAGQPRLYAGKELRSVTGDYDYGARLHFAPALLWTVPDALAEKYYNISPYTFCLANPIANFDNDGNRVFFINGMHTGDGGSSAYWGGLDNVVMDAVQDHNATYIDGAMGGAIQTGFYAWLTPAVGINIAINSSNANPKERYEDGYSRGRAMANDIDNKEEIYIVTHSMGGSTGKGFVEGLLSVKGDGFKSNIKWEIDIAPFQPSSQSAVDGVKTGVLQHKDDKVAGSGHMKGATYQPKPKNLGTSWRDLTTAHSIKSFIDEIDKFIVQFESFINKTK